MPYLRLSAGAAAIALMAAPAFAQTGGATGYGAATQPGSPTGAGAMQSPSTATQPYAPPPTTGGMAQPSAAQPAGGTMSGGAMSGGAMSGGSTAGAMASVGFTPIRPAPGANIIATLQASGEFTRLLAALQATNLTGLISTHPNLTLFAPTDTAFAQLPPGQLDTLMKSPAQLQAILTYHLVATTIRPTDVQGHAAGPVPAADNKQLTVDGSGPTIRVNDATVLQPGVVASNGLIYPINKVLTPPGV